VYAVRTETGRAWLREQLTALLDPPNGVLTIGGLETDIFTYAVVTNVTLARTDGARVAHLDRLQARWDLGTLPSGSLRLPRVEADGLALDLALSEAGLDLALLWDDGSPPSNEPWQGLPIDLDLPHVELRGIHLGVTVGDTVYGVERAGISGAVALRGPVVEVTGLSVGAEETVPELGPLSLTGSLRWEPTSLWTETLEAAVGPNRVALRGGLGRLDGEATIGVGISALHLDPASLAPLTGALPVRGDFEASGALAGLLGAPTVALELGTAGGAASLTGALDLREARPTWQATLVTRALALDAVLDTPPTLVHGVVVVSGAGQAWPADLDAEITVDLEAPRAGPLTDVTLKGAATLAAGVLRIGQLAATAPGARITGTGNAHLLEARADARLRQSRVELSALRTFGVPDLRGTLVLDAGAEVTWRDGVALAADGVVQAHGVAWRDIVTVDKLNGPIVFSWNHDEGMDAQVDVALSQLDAAGVSADVGSVDGRLRVLPSGEVDMDAQLGLRALNAPEVAVARVTGTLDAARAADGRARGVLSLATEDLVVLGWPSSAGSARLALEDEDATLTVDLLDGSRTLLAFSGEADLGARSIRARRLEVAPTDELAWRASGVQTARLVEGGVEDLRIRLTSGDALIWVEGAASPRGPLDLRAEVAELRLERIAALLPGRLDGYAGRLSLRASAEGRPTDPEVAVDLSADDLTIPQVVRQLDATIQGTGGGGSVNVDGRAGAGGRELARFLGSLPVSFAVDAPPRLGDGPLDLRLLFPPGDAEAWSAVLPGEPLPPFRASAELALGGTARAPQLGLVAGLEAPVGVRGEWMRLDVDLHPTPEGVAARVVGRERLERRLQLDGDIGLRLAEVAGQMLDGAPVDLAAPDTWVRDFHLDLVPLRVPVQALGALVDGVPQRLAGDLSGGLRLAGTLSAPILQGALLLTDGKLGELSLSPAMLTVLPETGGYRVETRVGIDNRGEVAVAGFVPLTPTLGPGLREELARPGLDLRVMADALPLTALAAAWPAMDASAGALSISGEITGSLLDPRPDLRFGLDDGDFLLSQTGVRYLDATLDGRLTHDDLTVSRVAARTTTTRTHLALEAAAGRIDGSFRARRTAEGAALSGNLSLDRAWIVDLPDTVLRLDGALALAERDGRPRVTGELALTEGNLVVPERFFTGNTDLALPPEISVHRRGNRTSERRAVDGAGTPLPDWVDADVRVYLQRNALLAATMPMEQTLGRALSTLSSITVDTQLDGELEATVRAGELSLVGEVYPVRGLTRVFGRPFDLKGNAISFTGKDWTDPVLDLEAVHDTADYGDITARITGTPSAIALELTAAESGLAQEDVLSVLVLGQPSSELGSGEGEALNGLLSLGLGAGTGFAAAELAQGLQLDQLEIDLNGLRFGRRLREDLYLLGELRPFVDKDEENQYEFTLEWRLGRTWQLDVTSGSSGFTTLGLNRKWRF
jgi:hypothetical protein